MKRVIRLSDKSVESIKTILEYFKKVYPNCGTDWTVDDVVALAIQNKLDDILTRNENELYLARLKERIAHHE